MTASEEILRVRAHALGVKAEERISVKVQSPNDAANLLIQMRASRDKWRCRCYTLALLAGTVIAFMGMALWAK